MNKEKELLQHVKHLSNKEIFKKTLNLLKKHISLCSVILISFMVFITAQMIIPILLKTLIDIIPNIIKSPSLNKTFFIQNTQLFQIILATITVSIFMFITTITSSYLIQKIVMELRQKIITHSLKQSMNYFNKEPIGSIVTTVTNDLDSASMFFEIMINQVFSSLLSLIALLITLFIINPYLTFSLFIGFPFIIVLAELYRKKILKTAQKLRTERQISNTYVAEHLQGADDLQLYNKTKQSITTFNTYTYSYYLARLQLGKHQSFVRPFLNLFLTLLIFIIIISGAYFVNAAIASIGVIIAFIQLAKQFFSPIITLAQQLTQVQESIASIERVFLFLDVSTELPNPSHLPSSFIQKENQYTLIFKNVCFSYKDNNPTLQNISFSLEPNKKIALVGYTGSGKSTIARLCVRFWDICEGHITLNGTNINNIPLSFLRNTVKLLQQDSFIFDGTLRDNICMGKETTQQNLTTLAKKSSLDELLVTLPKSWDSIINSQTLSVGQQRLIAICRILIDPPPIVLLDEFSAALDTTTEQYIQKLLSELQKNRSCLIIAHKLHTIQSCDEILYLKNGYITERGTHTNLLKLNGDYSKLLQHGNLS